jgi:hypothetical protein
MLGVFLLGLVTRCEANRTNIFAMLVSTSICLGLLLLIKQGTLQLGWSWLIVIGTATTFALSYLLAPERLRHQTSQ